MNAAIEAQGLEADRRLDIERCTAWTSTTARSWRWTPEPAQILAYVGSAGYYRDDLASRQLDPKFDVAGRGYRQPGSAWKPLVYAAGFDTGEITPGTLLLDVTTEFARGWVPRDADLRERGPVLVRDALTYSLNIPVIRALDRVGVDTVADAGQPHGPHLRRAATGTCARPAWPARSARSRRTWSS